MALKTAVSVTLVFLFYFHCPCVTISVTFICLYQEAVPFAVVGSNTVIEVRGRKKRGRLYPWGVVEVENPEHCDFIKLRTLLVYVVLIAIFFRYTSEDIFISLTLSTYVHCAKVAFCWTAGIR